MAVKQGARSINEKSSLNRRLFGECAQSTFSSRGREGLGASQTISQRRQELSQPWLFQNILAHCRLFEIEIFRKVSAPVRRKILQSKKALANQFNSLREPFAFVLVVFFAPEFLSSQFSLYHRQQFCGRHRANVLGVHPQRLVIGPVARIVFVKVKDRVSPADAFE